MQVLGFFHFVRVLRTFKIETDLILKNCFEKWINEIRFDHKTEIESNFTFNCNGNSRLFDQNRRELVIVL